MGIMKRFFSQTRKPEGFLGKVMLGTMNSGHAKLADWGLSHLPELEVVRAADLGCGAGRNEAALKAAGFREVKINHHPSTPWITVLARK